MVYGLRTGMGFDSSRVDGQMAQHMWPSAPYRRVKPTSTTSPSSLREAHSSGMLTSHGYVPPSMDPLSFSQSAMSLTHLPNPTRKCLLSSLVITWTIMQFIFNCKSFLWFSCTNGRDHHLKSTYTGEWFNADTEAVIAQALQTGAGPNVSDAYTINGLPGPLYNCSAGGT